MGLLHSDPTSAPAQLLEVRGAGGDSPPQGGSESSTWSAVRQSQDRAVPNSYIRDGERPDSSSCPALQSVMDTGQRHRLGQGRDVTRAGML